MTFKISPKYDADYLKGDSDIDKKLDVFEDRTKGWTLEWAKRLSETEHAGFAALAIALTYFEAHAIYYKGESSNPNKSKQFFRDAFIDVYGHHVLGMDLAGRIADNVYDQGRCGLFHEGMTKAKLLLRDDNGSVTYSEDFNTHELVEISINVQEFVKEIEAHFQEYMQRLRKSSEVTLRRDFERSWDRDYQLSIQALRQGTPTEAVPSTPPNPAASGSHLRGNP